MVNYKRKKKIILNKLIKYSKYLKAKIENSNKIKNYIIKNSKNKANLKLDILSSVSTLINQRLYLIPYFNFILIHRKLNPQCVCKHCLQLYLQTKYRLIKNSELSKDNYYIYNRSDTSYLICNFINIFNFFIYKNGFEYVDSIINSFDENYTKKYNLQISCYVLENKWIYINDELFKSDVQNMKNCLIHNVFNKIKKNNCKNEYCNCFKIYNYLNKNLSKKAYENIFIED